MSNFENDSNPDRLKPRLNTIAYTSAVMAEAVDFFLRPPTLTAINFKALKLTDPTFSAFKDLSLFKTVSKVQEANSILKVGFALSK